uniref:Aminotransferase-like protein n=1 Tax=Oryza sativa subsp. japonica TaxID=39947 RepID=Q6ZIY9_ORYSJ|nr:hypothetical protein [Oryza sativa Japonica Group]
MSSSASPSVAPSAEYVEVHWDEPGIGQALALTLANSAKDEPLMASAAYFWSNTLNAFLLNQGPMTPTLIDITMITGLDVISSANPMSLNNKNQFDFRTKSIGGWSGYVATYMGKGSVTPREHTTFLMMWLEKFLFYGSSYGPTTNWQFLAEALETKRQLPLGKILLDYLYQMLSNASAKIATGSVVGAGGPWWLLQTWLNLIVMRVVNWPPLTEAEFPRLEPTTNDDGEESNSGRDIEYALGLLPNGGGLAPPVLVYHAPRTSSLLQEQMREPADVGRKRKTKAPAVDPSALVHKKKAKKHKPKLADDLPALDPSIEQALDEEEIEEDVDQAAAELSDEGEKTPLASPKQTPPTPAAPTHFSRKKKTAVRKKSTATTLKPAPPTLADLFSFDIKDYFDKEVEEESTSKALAPLDENVKKTLEDISLRLESSLDNLVADCGSIRARFAEIQALIPDDLANTITPAVSLEQHQFKLEKAKQRIADQQVRKDIEATIQANRQLVHEEKAKLDQLSVGAIQSNIDRLEAHKIDLIAQLEECNAELDHEKQKLANLCHALKFPFLALKFVK